MYWMCETWQTQAAADAELRTLKAQVRRQQKEQKQSRKIHLSNASQAVATTETVPISVMLSRKSQNFSTTFHLFYC